MSIHRSNRDGAAEAGRRVHKGRIHFCGKRVNLPLWFIALAARPFVGRKGDAGGTGAKAHAAPGCSVAFFGASLLRNVKTEEVDASSRGNDELETKALDPGVRRDDETE